MDHKKIAIVGICCSGKSTLSRRLAESTRLPLFHMDFLFWKANWEKIPEQEYLLKHKELIEKDEWIIEGYIDQTMADRANKADLIIDLDYSGMLCVLRSIKRLVTYQTKSRPELAEGCFDNYSLHFLWTVLMRGQRKYIEEGIKGIDERRIQRIHNPKELEKYLKDFSSKISSDFSILSSH